MHCSCGLKPCTFVCQSDSDLCYLLCFPYCLYSEHSKKKRLDLGRNQPVRANNVVEVIRRLPNAHDLDAAPHPTHSSRHSDQCRPLLERMCGSRIGLPEFFDHEGRCS